MIPNLDFCNCCSINVMCVYLYFNYPDAVPRVAQSLIGKEHELDGVSLLIKSAGNRKKTDENQVRLAAFQ